MKSSNTSTLRIVCAMLAVAVGLYGQTINQAASSATAREDSSDDIYELSPFTVSGTSDVGYVATSTLAGTRIRTSLKDLGSAVSVYTTEFMADTGATDAGTLLSYTTNAEVGGNQGNFSGAEEVASGRFFQPEARTNPQFNQRIRGLGRADLTRGFFLTDIPFDSYNTDRVEVSRGPNSLLFGIGSPGGVVNNNTKQAIHNNTFAEVKFKVDNYGSQRSEFDVNASLIKDRLALRLAGLDDDVKYKQEPAWNRDKRIYVALDAVIFENKRSTVLGATSFRANGEAGNSRGSPVEVIPPSVAYHGWFEPTPVSIQQYSGIAPTRWVTHPSEGGTWRFQETYNPFLRNTEPSINTNSHPSSFRLIQLVYDKASSSTPNIGTGDGLQGYSALLPWNPNLDTLDSTGLAGTPGVGGATGSAGVQSTTEYHTNSPYAEPYAIGFAVPTLQNRTVFDYWNKVYSGGIDFVDRDFDAVNLALEQSFFNNRLAFELAYDKQHYKTWQDFFFTGGEGGSDAGPYDIYVAIAEYLPNGQPNPNLGRAYTRVRWPTVRLNEYDRETFRLTGFGEVDLTGRSGWLRHLGRHRFTGLYNDYTRNTRSYTWQESWSSNEFNISSALEAPTLNHTRRPINVSVYTSESLLGIASMDDIRLSQIQVPRFQPGDTFNVLYADTSSATAARRIQTGTVFVDRYLENDNISRTSIKAKAISWQSYFFDEHIVGLFGYRKDDTKSYARAAQAEVGFASRLNDGSWNPDFTRLSETPGLEESGSTITWSVVTRYPKKLLGNLPRGVDLQVHYAQSENFNPIGLRSDALGHPIGQPTGTTKEYGFLITTADHKVSLKLNWFKSSLENTDANPTVNVASEAFTRITSFRDAELTGAPFSSTLVTVNGDPAAFPIQDYETFYALMENAVPAALRDRVKPRREDTNGDGVWETMAWDPIPALRSTQDFVSKGFEVELVANPTPSWRILANISQQQAVRSNTAVIMAQVVEEFNQNLQAARLGELRGLNPGTTTQIRSINETWLTSGLVPVRAAVALDNTVSNEQREWRFSAVSTYSFRHGRLRGLSVGGAARWESKAATGYVYSVEPETGVPVPDVSRPFYDDGLFSGDCWISYERKLGKKIDWKIQLNVRNAFGDRDDIPVKTNPDGQVAVIRIPNPRTLSLSNTFRF